MKGYSGWSYSPYRPLLTEVGDIYICRIAPGAGKIHLEWLSEPGETYEIYYRSRNKGAYVLSGTVCGSQWDICGLPDAQDFELYVQSGSKKSRVRLARTGEAVGTVVNYLHPDDEAYSFSGRYLCSPSLVRHPDGYLLASMDLYAGGYPQNLTLIFRSDDDGETWHYVSELMPCFWGKLFIHKGELYMLSVATEYGDLLIGKSTDGGKTFASPVTLLRGANGKNGSVGVHKNPQNIMIHNGRLYETLEWGSWRNMEYYHSVMVMSCAVEDDLLVPENWHFSEPVKYDPTWPGTAVGPSKGNIEGTLCIAPDGTLYNVMRYQIVGCTPSHGLVLAFKVNTEDPDAPLTYSHSISFPGNHSKFMIKYDEGSKKYWSIVSRIDSTEHTGARNLLSLLSSDDMEHWSLVCDLLDYRHESIEKVGFQYVDFFFEGEDLLYLCRTALNEAHNYHDANYSTFHRIKNFRSL